MQPHNTRVAGTQADEGVLLCEGGLLLLMALEVGFVYPLDSILLPCGKKSAVPDLEARYEMRGQQAHWILTVE